MCLVSLVLNIRLNTLTFKSFATSGTHIFAYGSLILLRATTTFTCFHNKRIKYGLIAILTLIIFGLTLHAWLFIEMQLKGVVLTKLNKNNDPI